MNFVKPMEPILLKEIPNGDQWIHQIKWDGIRGISYVDDKVNIITKNGNNHTEKFPELQQIKQNFKGNNAILDGEIVVFDELGKPSFSRVLARDRVNISVNRDLYMQHPAKYIIFDILFLNGEDLRDKPYITRKSILTHCVNKSSSITITDDFNDGEALFRLMEAQNLEGIVSKRVSSVYKEGKNHEDWFKIKLNKKILAVVGGISLKNNYPNALLIGVFRNHHFEYIGKVATGLKATDLQLLNNYVHQLEISDCPFINIKKQSDYIWIKPSITCWVRFMDWTSSGGLRHPILIGFSSCSIREANGKEVVVK